MFRCKECGCEYKNKPDFCDCGNDTFEEVLETEPQKQIIDEIKTNIQIEQSTTKSIKNNFENSKSGVFYTPSKKKKSFSEQYPLIARFISSIDPISAVIFMFCIVLSLVIVLIPIKKNTSIDLSENIKEEQIVKNIPSLDSFWNNTPPKIKEELITEPEPQNVIEKVVENIIPLTKPVNTQVSKPDNTKSVKPSITKQTVSKSPVKTFVQPKTTAKPATVKQTAVAPNQTLKNSKPVVNNKKVENKTANSSATVTNQPKSQTTTQSVDPALLAAQQAKKAAESKMELDNYKYSLRNLIGRKIDFSKVIGDGNCTVSFRVSSSGQLINRSFSQQSTNITLNDAVYKAVMATPSYNPPPSSYKNETLKLSIKIYNGNFEVSLN